MFAVARIQNTTKQHKEKESTSDLYLGSNLLKEGSNRYQNTSNLGIARVECNNRDDSIRSGIRGPLVCQSHTTVKCHPR